MRKYEVKLNIKYNAGNIGKLTTKMRAESVNFSGNLYKQLQKSLQPVCYTPISLNEKSAKKFAFEVMCICVLDVLRYFQCRVSEFDNGVSVSVYINGKVLPVLKATFVSIRVV